MGLNPFKTENMPEDTLKPSQWIFIDKNIGKKCTMYDCFYCGLRHNGVEASGMFYCPNPKCTGPGVAWFNSKLKLYKDEGRGYSIDSNERDIAADLYLRRLEEAGETRPVEELLRPVTVEERLNRIERLLEKLLGAKG